MQTTTDEPVHVLVAFAKGKARPWKMLWGKSIYTIKNVNMMHGSREGVQKVFYFSVSDDDHAWKLRFNTETLEWRMVESYTP